MLSKLVTFTKADTCPHIVTYIVGKSVIRRRAREFLHHFFWVASKGCNVVSETFERSTLILQTGIEVAGRLQRAGELYVEGLQLSSAIFGSGC
jgi:hypothetical protein